MSASDRRRRSNNRQYSAEDQALNQISKEAESRLAAKRAARAEARGIRHREIEKQQKQAEKEQQEKSNDIGSDLPIKSAGRQDGSRRGSDDSTESSESKPDRNFKAELRELDDKYKKAMTTSAQLDNEKQTLIYQVELLKDQLEEQEEGFIELNRQYKEKHTELEMKKKAYKDLEHENVCLKEQMAYKDRLIEESGLMIVSRGDDGEYTLQKSDSLSNGPVPTGSTALLSSDSIDILHKAGEGSLDDKIKKLAADKKQLLDKLKTLESEVDEKSIRKEDSPSKVPTMNGPEMQLYEFQREASKTIHEYKFRLQKAEQDIATLEGSVTRLESQVKRYKTDAEKAEGMEDELKGEKRKLQRELREAQTQIEELTNQNKHLHKRMEKIKQTRMALGVQ